MPQAIVPGPTGGCSGGWGAGFLDSLLPVREWPWGRSLSLNPLTPPWTDVWDRGPFTRSFPKAHPSQARSGCQACAGKWADLATAPGILGQAIGGTSEWSHYAMTSILGGGTMRCKAEGTHNSTPCLGHFPRLNFLIYPLRPRFRTALPTYCPFTAQAAVTIL